MDRALIDRWTDTTTFRAALFLSALVTVPVLGLGLVVSIALIVVALYQQTAEFAGGLIVLLSVGGAVGFVGWLRSHREIKRPQARDQTATLVCLAIGAATALAVGAVTAVPTLETLRSPWGWPVAALPGGLFVAAQVVWVLSGIAWMQRLARHYAERAGRAFDGMPAVLLFVAVALAAAAALITTSL